jgi:hypothetical protein
VASRPLGSQPGAYGDILRLVPLPTSSPRPT